VTADEELTGIAAEMIAWKRKNPADDLLTALALIWDDLGLVPNAVEEFARPGAGAMRSNRLYGGLPGQAGVISL
jgi:hypothetical protein